MSKKIAFTGISLLSILELCANEGSDYRGVVMRLLLSWPIRGESGIGFIGTVRQPTRAEAQLNNVASIITHHISPTRTGESTYNRYRWTIKGLYKNWHQGPEIKIISTAIQDIISEAKS